MKISFPVIVAFMGAAVFVIAGPARGDVVTYPDGKVLRGVITELPDDPDSITLETDMGKIRIAKSRVKIETEPPVVGYLHIAQAYRARQRHAEALQATQKALAIEPANAAALKLLDEIQADISHEQEMTRQKAVVQIDELAAQSRELMKAGNFQAAVDLVKQANDLVPDPGQKPRLKALLSDIYLAWAVERLDKLDKVGAERNLNLAIVANPDNDEAVAKLLDLWQGDPTKMEQAAQVYETIIERHPDDDALRKKLADMYFSLNRQKDAAHHYLILYNKGDQYKGGNIQTNLIACLQSLHRQYAQQKDYDKAIYHYKVLSAIDPDTDPTEVLTYEYLKMAQDISQDDLAGQLKLAQWAEQNGIEQEALRIYRRLTGYQETAEHATAGLERYAQRTLTMAQTALKQGDYFLAQTLANQLVTDYPKLEKIQEAAADIRGQASLKMAEDRRERRERAKELESRGNEFYQQAYYNFGNIFSRERQDMPYLVSSRQEAIKYFTLAIQAYQEVLRIDPSIASDPTSVVNVRLRDSIARLNRLTAPMPPPISFGPRSSRTRSNLEK